MATYREDEKEYQSLRGRLKATYDAPRSNINSIGYNDDNQVSIIRVNDKIFAVKVGAPRTPLQQRFLNQYGFVVLNDKNEAFVIDILLYPGNEIYSLLQNTFGCKISAIALTHRHVLYLANGKDVQNSLQIAGYPKVPILLHKSEHNHKDSRLYTYNGEKINYTGIMNHPLLNDFDLDCILAGAHTEGSVLFYHKSTKSLIVGDLALADTRHPMLKKTGQFSESTPHYLSMDHDDLTRFWQKFDTTRKFKNTRYFMATHGEPIDCQKEGITIDKVLEPLRKDIQYFVGKKEKMPPRIKRSKL